MTKNHIYVFLLAIALILTFRIFEFFPGMELSREIWCIFGVGYFVFPYLFSKLVSEFRVSWFEIYVISLFVCVPLLGAIGASAQFGQPIEYGLIKSRGIFICVSALAIYRYFKLYDGMEFYIEKALIGVAWGTLILYCGINLVFDPSTYLDKYPVFVGDGMGDGDKFKLNTIFIVFGFFYYAFRGFRQRSIVDYLYSIAFLAYLIGVSGGRSLFVTVFITLIFFILRWGSVGRLIRLIPQLAVSSGLLLVMVFVVQEDFMMKFVTKLENSFTVVLTGETSGDSSADARIFEFLVAAPFILQNTMLGSGVISNQWNGGYEGVLGAYFYPSDIGLVGAVFNYGIIGVIFFSYQFIFGLTFSKRLNRIGIHGPLIDALKVMLFYIALRSIFTGTFVFRPEVSLLFISVLGGIALRARYRKPV